MSTRKSKIPVIRSTSMKERGYATYMLICPVCQRTYEKLQGDEFPTKCQVCSDVVCISWVRFTAEKKMAEIDLMPMQIFFRYVQKLGLEMLKRNNIETAKVLAAALVNLSDVLHVPYEMTKEQSWTLIELQQYFTAKSL